MKKIKYLPLFLLLSCKTIIFTGYNTIIYEADSVIVQSNSYKIYKPYKYFNSIDDIKNYCERHTYQKQTDRFFYSYTLTNK